MATPAELGKLHCTRARLEVSVGQPDAARATLAEAQAIAATVGAGPNSELGKMLVAARAAVEAA